jgi:hypothetical protein
MSKQVDAIRIVVHESDLAVEEIRKFFRARSTAAQIWVERPEGRVRDAEWPFVLGNGQVDYYPASWTLAAARVAAALEQFAGTGTMPRDVAWHDDAAGE